MISILHLVIKLWNQTRNFCLMKSKADIFFWIQLNFFYSSICGSEPSVFVSIHRSATQQKTLKKKHFSLWSLELSPIQTKRKACLSAETTMFVWVSISKPYIFPVVVFISSEPENVLLSPENPSGDSASHLQRLSQFLYLLQSRWKIIIKKTTNCF